MEVLSDKNLYISMILLTIAIVTSLYSKKIIIYKTMLFFSSIYLIIINFYSYGVIKKTGYIKTSSITLLVNKNVNLAIDMFYDKYTFIYLMLISIIIIIYLLIGEKKVNQAKELDLYFIINLFFSIIIVLTENLLFLYVLYELQKGLKYILRNNFDIDNDIKYYDIFASIFFLVGIIMLYNKAESFSLLNLLTVSEGLLQSSLFKINIGTFLIIISVTLRMIGMYIDYVYDIKETRIVYKHDMIINKLHILCGFYIIGRLYNLYMESDLIKNFFIISGMLIIVSTSLIIIRGKDKKNLLEIHAHSWIGLSFYFLGLGYFFDSLKFWIIQLSASYLFIYFIKIQKKYENDFLNQILRLLKTLMYLFVSGLPCGGLFFVYYKIFEISNKGTIQIIILYPLIFIFSMANIIFYSNLYFKNRENKENDELLSTNKFEIVVWSSVIVILYVISFIFMFDIGIDQGIVELFDLYKSQLIAGANRPSVEINIYISLIVLMILLISLVKSNFINKSDWISKEKTFLMRFYKFIDNKYFIAIIHSKLMIIPTFLELIGETIMLVVCKIEVLIQFNIKGIGLFLNNEKNNLNKTIFTYVFCLFLILLVLFIESYNEIGV
jgi:formate hydrogenlyase subunit 3/multisubunit Na+/H+ antiporter MnhD subunit